MTTVDVLTERNASFASDAFPPGLRMMPRLRAMIIGCVDPRVDPAQILGLRLGDAAILRNVGGRVTPAILENMDLLQSLGMRNPPAEGEEWTLIVLHHTDCGITRLINPPEPLAAYLGISKDALDIDTVTDPRAAVMEDIASLRRAPGLPAHWLVTGLVYDVETGLIDVVVPPSPLGATEQASAGREAAHQELVGETPSTR